MQKSWNKLTWLVIFFTFTIYVSGQNPLSDDIRLIREIRLTSEHTKKIRPFIYKEEKNLLKKINPLNLAAGGLLFFYQNALSPQFSASCLYNPSCSEFSKRAILKYGFFKGTFLTTDRLMRCNRLAATGIHPVRMESNKVADPVQFYRFKE